MNNSPHKRKKSNSSSSSNLKPAANSNSPNISPQGNQDFVTIEVAAVEICELTQEEQSDKPNGIAPLTAFTLNAKWNGHFLRRERR